MTKQDILENIKRILDTKANGAHIHDMNMYFGSIRNAVWKTKKLSIKEQDNLFILCHNFRMKMSQERMAFKNKPSLIIELWDLLDKLIQETCTHKPKTLGSGTIYCNRCKKVLTEAEESE
jgi:hypothetical protein